MKSLVVIALVLMVGVVVATPAPQQQAQDESEQLAQQGNGGDSQLAQQGDGGDSQLAQQGDGGDSQLAQQEQQETTTTMFDVNAAIQSFCSRADTFRTMWSAWASNLPGGTLTGAKESEEQHRRMAEDQLEAIGILKASVERIKKRLEERSKDIEEMKAEYEKVKADYDEAIIKAQQEQEKLNQAIAATENELALTKVTLEEVYKLLESLTARMEKTKQSLEECKGKSESKAEEIEQWLQQQAQLLEEIEIVKQKKVELEEKFAQEQSELEEWKKAMEENNKALQDQMNDRKQKLDIAVDAYNRQKESLEAWKSTFPQVEGVIEEVEKARAERQQEEGQQVDQQVGQQVDQQSQQEQDVLAQKAIQLGTEVGEKGIIDWLFGNSDKEDEQVEQDADNKSQILKEQQDFSKVDDTAVKAKLEEIKGKLCQQADEVVQELLSFFHAVKQHEQAMDELNKQIESNEQQKNSFSEMEAQLIAQLAELELQYEQSVGERDSMLLKFSNFLEEAKAIKAQLEDMLLAIEADIETTMTQLTIAIQRKENLETSLNELTSQLTECQDVLAQLETDAKVEADETAKLEEVRKRLEEENKNYETEQNAALDALDQEIGDMEDENRQIKMDSDAYLAEFKKTTEDTKALSDETEKCAAAYAESQSVKVVTRPRRSRGQQTK